MPKPLTLGIALRVYDRPQTTRIVLDEVNNWKNLDPAGLLIKTVVWADRPTPGVQKVLRTHEAAGTIDEVVLAPYPMLDSRGEHFLEAQNDHLDALERHGPLDWIYVSDDDYWFEPVKAYERLIPALRRTDVDLYFSDALFFWDSPTTFNARRQHHSAFIYRQRKGERHSGLRMLKVPDSIYDLAILRNRERVLDLPLLEYGSFTEADRRAVFDRYIAAGKDDPFVRTLIEPPDLRIFPDDVDPGYGRWIDRYTEALRKWPTAPTS